MPLLRVNESTLEWQEFPPNTNNHDYFEYEYEAPFEIELSKNLKDNDGVVTGIFLYNLVFYIFSKVLFSYYFKEFN